MSPFLFLSPIFPGKRIPGGQRLEEFRGRPRDLVELLRTDPLLPDEAGAPARDDDDLMGRVAARRQPLLEERDIALRHYQGVVFSVHGQQRAPDAGRDLLRIGIIFEDPAQRPDLDQPRNGRVELELRAQAPGLAGDLVLGDSAAVPLVRLVVDNLLDDADIRPGQADDEGDLLRRLGRGQLDDPASLAVPAQPHPGRDDPRACLQIANTGDGILPERELAGLPGAPVGETPRADDHGDRWCSEAKERNQAFLMAQAAN